MGEDVFEDAPIRINRSLRRAMLKGQIGPDGERYSKRPFSNKANTCKRKGKHSRELNEFKKKKYEWFLHRKAF